MFGTIKCTEHLLLQGKTGECTPGLLVTGKGSHRRKSAYTGRLGQFGSVEAETLKV